MNRKAVSLAIAIGLSCGLAFAKLPPPDEKAKAAAEAAKTKAAETTKKDAELLTASQDRVADRYIQQMKAKGVIVKPTPIPPPAPPAGTPAPAPAAAAAAAAAPKK